MPLDDDKPAEPGLGAVNGWLCDDDPILSAGDENRHRTRQIPSASVAKTAREPQAMRYLLDTNVLSEAIRNEPNRGLLQRLVEVAPRDVVTWVVSVAELRHGPARVAHGARLWERIAREILSRVDIFPLGEAEAVRAGDLLATLEVRSEPRLTVVALAENAGYWATLHPSSHF